MAIQFPEELDSFLNPQPTDSVAAVSHAAQHADANDAIEALQAKVGVDGSTNATSLDYRVTTLENNPVIDTDAIQDIVAGVLNAGTHTNITVTYDDDNNKISLASTYGDEQVISAIATALTAGYGITKTYNAVEDKIIIEVNTDSIATQDYVDAAVAAIVDAAPGLLDTLNEIAAAIGDDANFVTTINNSISSAITTATNNAAAYTDQEILALSTVYDPLGAAATAEENAKDYADGLAINYDPAGSATTAEENAKDYADGLAINYDPAGAATTAESNANQYTNNQISNLTTDSFLEGPNNKYFTVERAQDAAASALTGGTHTNITVSYDDDNNHINLTVEQDGEYVVDTIATALTAGNGISKTVDDEANTITISVDTSVVATQTYVNTAISNLIDSAPEALDTLNEIAAALGDDSNFATTITNALATKITASSTDTLTNKTIDLSDNTISGTLADFNQALTDANFATTTDVSDAISDANVYTDSAIQTHNFATSGVHGVSGDVVGTTDSQVLTNKTMGNDLLMDGNQISGLGIPTQADHAATKAYVDSVTEGLHVHASVHAATTENISSFTGISSLIIDGHTIQDQERVLVKDQTSPAENGIYVYDATLQTLTRSLDYNELSEIDAGDFVFVSNGSLYNNTGWVQENNITVLGTDAISWVQFSGAGTYLSGNGLILDGNVFEIDDTITATKTYVDTQDAATLESANDYTDLAIAGLGDTVESGYIPIGQKANPNGVASLDANGKVPSTQLNQEDIQDFVAPLLNHALHTNISVTYDDANNRLVLQGMSGGGGGASVIISATPPTTPGLGDIWLDSDNGKTYIWDGSFWVEIGAGSAQAVAAVVSTPPANPILGTIWMNSSTAKTYIYDGSFWAQI